MRYTRIILVLALAFISTPSQNARSEDMLVRRGNSMMLITTRFRSMQASQSFLSPNGQYQVIIEDTETFSLGLINVNVTMTKVTNPSPTVLWRNNGKSIPAGSLRPEDVVIADDGQFFLLATTEERWILFKKDHAPEVLKTAPSGADPVLHGIRRTSMPNDLIAIERIEKRPVIRIWHAVTDQWEAFRADTGQKIAVANDLLVKWNAIQRDEILKKIDRLKKDGIRRKVGGYSPKLSQVATNFIPQVKYGEIRDIHYQFLALRRIPEDRAIFNEMLAPQSIYSPVWSRAKVPPGGSSQTIFQRYPSDRHQQGFLVYDFQRLQGDALLALFEQKASYTNLLDALLTRPQFYLGRASGRVHLPVSIQQQRAGPLRVWLVPKEQIKKDWIAAGAEFMETDLKSAAKELEEPATEISFTFMNVTPGEYLLKSIWDKRPAFEDRQKAGPGDYQSSWLPITITAGNTTSNLYSLCTNRVPTGGETYYAADDLFRTLSSRR
jgi:hypothetical protein